jgi:hypothetical protein
LGWSIVIAAGTGKDRDLGPFLMTLAVLIVVVVVAGLVLIALRKRMLAGDEEGVGSIFEDLRQMRAEGTISEAEYEYLRRCMAARAAGREPPPRPAELADDGDLLVAPPGYDLTGARIPAEVLEAMRRHREGRG